MGELCRSLTTLIADVTAIKADIDNIKGGKRKAALQPEEAATSGQKRQKTAALQPRSSTSRESDGDEDSDTAENNLISAIEGQEAESEESADGIQAEIALAFESSEEMGPPVSEELVAVLKGKSGKKLQDAKLKSKLATYLIPENCAFLAVPCTNQEVFTALKPYIRKVDVQLTYGAACPKWRPFWGFGE